MKLHLFIFFFVLGTFSGFAQTQEEEPADRANNKRRWEAHLPGGRYVVNLGNITSISVHSYVLDGGVVVTEVTIDTVGSSLARFYFIEPVTETTKLDIVKRLQNRTSDLQKQAKNRTGVTFADMAQKHYPDTTHAKTVEFRLLSRTELNALYDSLYTAWDSGRGRTFKIAG